MTIALAVCATLPVMAQRGPGGPGGMGGPGGGRGNRVDFLAGYLELTAAQKTAATTIFEAADSAATVISGQLTSAHEALRSAVKAGKVGELEALSAPIGTLHGQLTAIHAKAESQFYALLTTEQKAKYDERGGGPGKGPGGMHGRGPHAW